MLSLLLTYRGSKMLPHAFDWHKKTKTKKQHKYIQLILASLYWLAVDFRIHFIIILVFKALNALTPSNVSELLHPYTPSHCLSRPAAPEGPKN